MKRAIGVKGVGFTVRTLFQRLPDDQRVYEVPIAETESSLEQTKTLYDELAPIVAA